MLTFTLQRATAMQYFIHFILASWLLRVPSPPCSYACQRERAFGGVLPMRCGLQHREFQWQQTKSKLSVQNMSDLDQEGEKEERECSWTKGGSSY